MTYRTIICRQKDLNARGNGNQDTRRVRLPDGTRGWASDVLEDVTGYWSSGTFLAADRRCAQRGRAPVGTVVVEYSSSFRGGKKSGTASIRAGIVVSEEEGAILAAEAGDAKPHAIRWGLSYRRRGSDVEVKVGDEWVAV